MKYRHPAVVSAVGLLALSLSACSSGNSTGGSAPGSGAPAQQAKVAMVLKTTSNQFWATMEKGAKAAAGESKTSLTAQSATAEGAIEEQTALLQNLAGGDYSCYAVAPISGTNLIQPLSAIQQAGHTIINLDSPIDTAAAEAAGVNIASFIASNNHDAGRMAGEKMAKLLGGKGSVAVVGGIAGDANSAARTGGFTDAAKAGGLTIVQEVAANWDRQLALDAADNILRSHPDLGGFYTANDTMALGAVQANQNNGTKAFVIGTDGNEDALTSISQGKLTATVSQYPSAVGRLGVDACRAAATGAALPKKVDAPIALVEAANVKDALAKFPEPFKEYANPFSALIR
ncbi:substrate-binding domain-containing protein [Arthrobacter sp. ISL-5]|uniref:substrate-binding domain-containing protein n=1 Tax=Arthrobacter sp. ISL-5 TaxID=2819111 RepID=UPI001BEB4BD6|nr:substrate-binding domain-containing protein [Arthrobacter sp. ISL-5]MBT2555282.1 substrate-binding domain-containing protein [Arthrobacter sp. ISL-5]